LTCGLHVALMHHASPSHAVPAGVEDAAHQSTPFSRIAFSFIRFSAFGAVREKRCSVVSIFRAPNSEFRSAGVITAGNKEQRSMRTLCRWIVPVVAVALMTPRQADAGLVSYTASTGQTATADFSFIDGNTLQIVLSETTPVAASSLTGAAAILTSIGFDLPGTVQLVASTGVVTISPGSVSVGLSLGDLGAGADVSREWGATQGQFDPGDGGSWDFISVNTSHVTQFAGVNRDGPDGLDGPQPGLLLDSAARGGTGIVNNSVTIIIDLNSTLSAAQQAAFLLDVETNSIVEYGSDAAFGTPDGVVPEPSSIALLLIGVAGFGVARRRRNRV
jgi:hypothetical protein